MNGYSQGKEDKVVAEYFLGRKGALLSIGENNGLHLSNALYFIEEGWSACLVEPSETPYKELKKRHEGNTNLHTFNYAIGETEGEFNFYDSGTHLHVGDTGLLSTLNIADKVKWQKTTEFTETKVQVITFANLLELSPIKLFNFITIDAEGFDLIILRQMNLKELGCECLCIEHNGDENTIQEIKQICSWYGLLNEILRNAENIIMTI